ncbi:hypothetical protein NM208_g16612 [Fusarium decemcellulare]|uniref:Uncharacterized protein n=1 Tax=Fusarium decemcellulare TaxID=57161 RepID=A0ACC1RCC0_9HYPO|nr:hypothetical protein NM208_g16612 [Fusarium decemcellulare]
MACLAIPIVIVFWIAGFIWKRTGWLTIDQIDLDTGLREHDWDHINAYRAEVASWPKWRQYLHKFMQHLSHLETSSKLGLLQELLCVRPPQPPLPDDILDKIDSVLLRSGGHRVFTDVASLTPSRVMKRDEGADINLHLWRGDITTLTGITAITNAANGQMLGCFQPTHRCIDNIIHSRAGPRLRAECFQTVEDHGRELEPGEALVTRGYALPALHVIHTVGPQLSRGASPTEIERKQLAKCYESVLEALEVLPSEENGGKAVALCCVSTGLFAFPAQEAAEIALATVLEWLREHPDTTISDIIFNTFTESDTTIYSNLFDALPEDWILPSPSPKPFPLSGSVALARDWLNSADAVLVSAGAGMSAAEGLDYHSRRLFAENFPGFLKLGLKSLYSVIGYNGWPSEEHRWGYFFSHMKMMANWPKTPTYQALLPWLDKFGPDAHVRTSNADGLFLANGWREQQLSTPQGSYAVLQCLEKCRVEATTPSAPLFADAAPYLDKVTQKLTDSSKVPRCRFCGAKMNICVRGGSWFNDAPFQEAEKRWKAWKSRMIREKKKVVILELGRRWPGQAGTRRDGA